MGKGNRQKNGMKIGNQLLEEVEELIHGGSKIANYILGRQKQDPLSWNST